MKHEMHQYHVKGLALHEESQIPFLILENRSENDTITIQVAANEADTLLLQISGAVSPFPTSHDAIAKFLNRHALHPLYLEINHLGSSDARAVLHYRGLFRHHTMTLQPADGITLAVRLDIPIYLTPEAIITGTISNPLPSVANDNSQSFLYVDCE